MLANKLSSDALQENLNQFTGTEHWHPTMYPTAHGRLHYTEGIKFLAEEAGAYWLVDLIGSYQPKCAKDPMLRDFQVWYLTRPGSQELPWFKYKHENSAIASCWRDTPQEDTMPPIRQYIPFTDFPMQSIKLYVSQGILLLPSEY